MDSQPPDRPAPENQSDDIAPLQGGELRVVGLGASAGGLRALRQFFAQMPSDSGMAFVVILHLSPEYESNLAGLLQFSTAMPVTQVTETTPVEPNHIYVIPPAKHLSIADGRLRLSKPQQTSGQRVSIDLFFRTLAEAHGHNAAVVILSGAGSDGTIGLKRVKESGGVTLVQDPQDAEYDSMPRNAIATGLVDFVLPADQLPRQILTYWRNAETIRLPLDDQPGSQSDTDALHEVFTLLRVRTGHDFTNYKRSTVLRRIGRRMQVNGVSDIPTYLAALRERSGEAEALLRDLLISVTNFFRDHEAFGALEAIVPKLFVGKTTGDQLRVWVAGCATGEEAYSVAILLREYADKLDNPPEIQIFATDIDEEAIGAARQGRYLEVIEADVSPERLRRFFSKVPGGYWIKKEVRDLVLFAVHNLLRDPPFSKLDLITCRNLLIYLDREVQQQILQLFHFVLRPDGLLMLGTSESADGGSNLFSPIDKSHRLFARRAVARTVALTPSMPLTGSIHKRLAGGEMASAPKTLSFGELHLRLLEQYAPPSAIVNESYEILHLSDRAGRFLQFGGGEPSYNLLKVVHPDLRIELRVALFRATQSSAGSEARDVPVQIDGATRLVNLIVRPVQDPGLARGFVLVLFDEVGQAGDAETSPDGAAAIEPIARQLDEELQHTKDQLSTMIEQYETSVEELKASNEELQTINEELHSATEELETSKEELQSINEELITVNNELKAKVDELSRVNSDLQNFLAATDIGTIFLDHSLRIVRYTPQVTELFNLIPSDLSRPLAHITHRLKYDNLPDDATQVIEQLTTVEHEVQHADGRWYIARFLPYRTSEDKIGGVVLTFVDITQRKRAELLLRDNERWLEDVLAQMPAGVLIADLTGRITFVNTQAERIYGRAYPRSQSIADYGEWRAHTAVGQPYAPDQVPLARALLQGETVTGEEMKFPRADGTWVVVKANATPIRDTQGAVAGAIVAFTDITERRREEEALLAARRQTERILETITDAYASIDQELHCWYMNRANEQLLGIRRDGSLGKDFRQLFAQTDIARYVDRFQKAMDERVVVTFDAYYPSLEKWVEVRIFPTDIGGLTVYQRDITERKRVEERFRISEERLRLLNENVQDYAIIMLDPQGRVLDWNVGAERMFGYDAEEMLGQSTICIFTPEDIAQGVPEQEIRTAESQGRSEDERWHVRKDGGSFWVGGVITAVYDEAGRLRGFWKIARDMTERMQAEAELRRARDELEVRVQERTSELARANEALQLEVAEHARAEAARRDLLRQLVTAEEEERKRISRELHDQMGQQLTALLLGLQTLKDSSHSRRATVRAVAELQRMADTIGQEVHQLALQLRPTALDDLGLAAALANYAAEWAQQTQIEVDFHGGGLEHKRLAPHIETIVYRVVLEALTNVLKHARARHISIILERRDEHAIAIVEDDGLGFDAEERQGADQRLGLRGMRERVALVGGTLTIESTPGTGTTVFVRVPLNPIPEGVSNG